MAAAKCFRLLLRRSLVKWEKIASPSPKKLWKYKEFSSECVAKVNICRLSPDFSSKKRKQDDRGGIFYAVVFGTLSGECIGEDSASLSGEDQEKIAINKPSGNVKARDSSGRFSSSNKLLNTRERKGHATDLLKRINSAKRKLDCVEEQEEEHKERWKRTTRSVTVSFFFPFSLFTSVPDFTCNTRPVVTRSL